jgi:hypothetical protein
MWVRIVIFGIKKPFTNWDRLARQREDFTTFVALFFLLAGLAAFGVAFPFMNYLEGIFGILAAIFTFLDK